MRRGIEKKRKSKTRRKGKSNEIRRKKCTNTLKTTRESEKERERDGWGGSSIGVIVINEFDVPAEPHSMANRK